MKTLILEDEPDLLKDFGDCVKGMEPNPFPSLGKTNFHVDEVESAAKAKELLLKAGQEAQPYDVMLLDLAVPENRGMANVEEGLNVLKLAQKARGAREVVVVSGNTEGMNRARGLGAKHFVNKQGYRKKDLETEFRIVAAIRSTKILENRIRELTRQGEHSLVYHFGLCFSRCLQEVDRASDAIEGELHDRGDALMHQVAGLRDALKSGRRNWAELQTALGLGSLASPAPISIRKILDGLKQKLAPCLFIKNAKANIEGELEATVLSFNGDATAVLSEMILGRVASISDNLDVTDNRDQTVNLVVSSHVQGDWVEVVLHDNLASSLSDDDAQNINEGIGIHTGPRFSRAWGLSIMQHVAQRGGGRLMVEMPGEGNTIKYRIPRAHNA